MAEFWLHHRSDSAGDALPEQFLSGHTKYSGHPDACLFEVPRSICNNNGHRRVKNDSADELFELFRAVNIQPLGIELQTDGCTHGSPPLLLSQAPISDLRRTLTLVSLTLALFDLLRRCIAKLNRAAGCGLFGLAIAW